MKLRRLLVAFVCSIAVGFSANAVAQSTDELKARELYFEAELALEKSDADNALRLAKEARELLGSDNSLLYSLLFRANMEVGDVGEAYRYFQILRARGVNPSLMSELKPYLGGRLEDAIGNIDWYNTNDPQANEINVQGVRNSWSQTNVVVDIVQHSRAEFFAIGNYGTPGSSGKSFFIHTDSSGNKLAQGSLGDEWLFNAKKIVKVPDGYLVAGTGKLKMGESSQLVIIKLSRDFTKLWTRSYEYYPNDIRLFEALGQNRFAIIAPQYDVYDQNTRLRTLITGLVVDGTGIEQTRWDSLKHRVHSEFVGPQSGQATTDGNLCLLGNTRTGDSRRFSVLKISGNGEILWERSIPNAGGTHNYSVVESAVIAGPDGGCILAAPSRQRGMVTQADPTIVRYDENGDEIHRFSMYFGPFRGSVLSLSPTADGGYVIFLKHSQEGQSIVRIKPNGYIKWIQKIPNATLHPIVFQAGVDTHGLTFVYPSSDDRRKKRIFFDSVIGRLVEAN